MAPKMNQKSLYGDAQRDQAKTPPLAWARWGCRMGPKRNQESLYGHDQRDQAKPPKRNQKSLYGEDQRDQTKPPPSLGHVGGAEFAMIPAPES